MGEAASTTGLSGSRFILLTDIYQSSRLSEQYPAQYAAVLAQHNAAVEQVVPACAGQVYKNIGDGYIALFDTAADCLACAVSLQQQFSAMPSFSEADPFDVRVVAHGGVLRPVGSEFYGPALNRASRICQVCYPGQVLASAAVAGDAAAELPREAELLDLGEHHLRDLAVPEHLFQLDHASFSRHEFPALATLANRPNNLLEQPNLFVGRERELAELKSLLLGNRRLVTITAPGGYGKSRLAAHLCADLLTAFERGVFFVELAHLPDHSGIAMALADATGFRLYGSREPKDQLLDYLREKETLLCFDNFEHVLEGAPFISDILKQAPKVKVAVTSREPLRIKGEQLYVLDPLPLSGGREAGNREENGLQLGDSVLLFADRAALVNASFLLSEGSLPGVQAICRRLDGIPLAIEIAAAWMDSFTLDELLAELDQQLELTAHLTDVPGRHRSLRASLDWSWNLLSQDQRETLMRLSAFRGGCFVEAASAVLGVGGLKLRRRLSELSDKSWLFAREISGQTRFFLRDAVSREYAFEKLQATQAEGKASTYEDAVLEHARYFSSSMTRDGERLQSHGQVEALQRIAQEKQNIYEALDTILNRLARGDTEAQFVELIMPIVRWLWVYLDITSACREMVDRYEVIKDSAEQAGNQERVLLWALLGCSRGRWIEGAKDAAVNEANRAVAVARSLGEPSGVAASLRNLGEMEERQFNYVRARKLCDEALAIFRRIADRSGCASSLYVLGSVESSQSNFNVARQLWKNALQIYREIGDRDGIADVLRSLGDIEYREGQYDAASKLMTESLDYKRLIGNPQGIAHAIRWLAGLVYFQGDYGKAREMWTESLEISHEIGALEGIAASLNNLGIIEYVEGNLASARDLLVQALSGMRQIGHRAGCANALNNLGLVEQSLHNYRRSYELHTEALAIRREIGGRWGAAASLRNLGILDTAQRNFHAARDKLAQALAISQEVNDLVGICESSIVAGYLFTEIGDIQAGAICLLAARGQAIQLRHVFAPPPQKCLDLGLKLVEDPEFGLSLAERKQLAVQAESMTLDELAEYVAEALANLENQKQTPGTA